MNVLICLCTCPDAASARTLATALVEERLAACVNQLPGLSSTYRWEGRVERAEEVLLMIKTTREHVGALTARVQALHPAELPEVIAVEAVGGLAPYLEWVVAETGPARPAACDLPHADHEDNEPDPMSPT
ncbi:MAG: divalent-cation tolerance protein CutA [Proteobacteria bacterium]|nr:divalent-cation tolerance protein CutA [Pseudomonadota bacterium]